MSGVDIALKTVKRDEGLRLKPYRCTEGKLTIGYGRNIEDHGINEEEAELMLQNDLLWAESGCFHVFSDWWKLNEVRKGVLINMAFNLGIPRLRQFKNMIAAVDKHDYEKAADEMLDSKWAKQVGNRATRLADTMRSGKWDSGLG